MVQISKVLEVPLRNSIYDTFVSLVKCPPLRPKTQVREIRSRYVRRSRDANSVVLAAEYHVTGTTILRVVHNQAWRQAHSEPGVEGGPEMKQGSPPSVGSPPVAALEHLRQCRDRKLKEVCMT